MFYLLHSKQCNINILKQKYNKQNGSKKSITKFVIIGGHGGYKIFIYYKWNGKIQ